MGARLTNRERGEFIHISVPSNYLKDLRSDQVDALKHICLKQRSIHNKMTLKMQVWIGLDFNQDWSYVVTVRRVPQKVVLMTFDTS